MARIIFLDIDGVLTSRKSARQFRNFISFLPGSVEALNKILESTDAQIVISSCRRIIRSLDDLRGEFSRQGIDGSRIIGLTPNLAGGRGLEIGLWLRDATLFIESFVVIDDESTGLERYTWRLVKTNFEDGLKISHAEEAIKMLMEQI